MPMPMPCTLHADGVQGKLDQDKRAALIQRGQALKDQLAEVETGLDTVSHQPRAGVGRQAWAGRLGRRHTDCGGRGCWA